MSFLSGTATFERYWITKDPTPQLGPHHIELLEQFKIEPRRSSLLEEPNVGFAAGTHLLDTRFAVEKNIFGDAMHFSVRIDTDQIPAAIRNAWLQMELLPLTADNPSGKPTKQQREEAKEAVEARCSEEATSGRYRRMQQTSVLWDALHSVLYIGGTSEKSNELCIDLLGRTFDIEVERITSGTLAANYASEAKILDAFANVAPTDFLTGESTSDIDWWNGMAENHDYMGNEFLLWLWWNWDKNGPEIKLSDDSIVSGMFARTLALHCPRNESGKDTISAESPVALPEALLAVRSGKLPRKAGLTLVRHDEQYDVSLQPETWTFGGAKVSQLKRDGQADQFDRINSIRGLTETVDLLFHKFCEVRIGKSWPKQWKSIRDWMDSADQKKGRHKAA